MKRRTVLLTLSLALACCSVASAGKVPVTVTMKIESPDYRQHFGAQTATIEGRASERIATLLAKRIGCFDFTTGPSADTLSVALREADDLTSFSDFREVAFFLSLDGRDVERSAGATKWTFRPKDQFDIDLGDSTAFVSEVATKFGIQLGYQVDTAIQEQFRYITIAREALPVPGENWWVLPFTRKDMELDRMTKFQIVVKHVRSGAAIEDSCIAMVIGDWAQEDSTPVEFWAGAVAKAECGPQSLAAILNATTTISTKLFIMRYVRRDRSLFRPDEVTQ